MKKRISILITILWGGLSFIQAQRTFNEMRHLAMQKLSTDNVSMIENWGGLYVYGNDNGFVLLNRNSSSNSIIGYSKTRYDKNHLPDGLKWWMKMAENSIQTQNNSTSFSKRAAVTAVEPFITTTWNQEKPYYYLCPKSGTSYCLTGCVATTLAQVLKYYEYPATAKGEGAYTLNEKETSKKITTTYDWANMKDSYKSTELRFSTPVKAVAALMRDCGYATYMNYSTDGSGTSDIYMALALRENFKYDSLAIKYYDRGYYDDEEWKDMVYSTLSKKMPVMYAGANEDGTSAHEFLLCGIDAVGLVYVNWGWGGSGDGFYDLDMLKYFGNEFNHNQSMVIGTKPQETPDTSDKFESMWIADAIDYAVEDEDVLKMSFLYLFNYSILDFNGTIDLTLEDKTDKSNVTYLNLIDTHEKGVGRIQPFYGYYFVDEDTEEMEPVYIEGLKSLAPGIYRMCLTAKEDRDQQRQIVRNAGGIQYATLKKLSSGQVLVSNADVDDISTDIQTVRTSSHQNGQEKTYNLRGMGLNMDAHQQRKGIYIINGKKVIR